MRPTIVRGASALAFRRCFASSTVGASIKQQRPTLSARQPFDGDDEEEEYYVEEPFDFEEAEKLQARPRSEYLSSVSLPDGLDEALRKHSLPALRKLKDAPEGEQLTVHHFAGLRLDLAYGASHRVLHEVRRRLPAASFSRALDFGAGLTPLSWALHTLWDDDDDVPAEVVAVEPNQRLRELGARLTLDGGLPVRWTGVMPKIEPEQSPFDLVCSAYALAPLTSAAQARAPSGEAVSGFISQSKADPWHYRYARRSRQGDTWQGFDQVNLCGVGSARLEQGKPIGKKVGFGPHDDTRTQSDANVVNDDKGTASVMQADELIRSNDDVDDEEEYEYYYEDEGEDADTSKDARS